MGHRRLESYADSSSSSPEREPFVNGSTTHLNGNGQRMEFSDKLPFNFNSAHSWLGSSNIYERAQNWLRSKKPSREARREVQGYLFCTSTLAAIIALAIGVLVGSYFAQNAHIVRVKSHPQQCRANVGRWSPIKSTLLKNGTTLEKPEGVRVVGVVFYGRRQFVDILDCYLRRNLVTKGGFLDEVQFLIHSAAEDDENWLREFVEEHAADLDGRYKLIKDKEIESFDRYHGFAELWGRYLTDPDTLYFKIDDDIVFIDDAAIPRMTHSLLAHPEAYSMQANVVNNMRTHWYHLRTGAILPYLPETTRKPPPCCNSTWRASDLPCYDEPLPNRWEKYGHGFRAPYKNHRWLPLENTPQNLLLTPFAAPLPSADIICEHHWTGWTTEAQLHYSFLHNLEHKLLSRYDFGNEEGIWNLWYRKYNINFMAMRGSTVSQYPFWGKNAHEHWADEKALTYHLPKKLQMPVLIDTRAVVSHYSFKGIRKHLLKTDLLARYRAYANEMVCEPGNQKKSFAENVHEYGEDPQIGDENDVV